MTGDRTGGPAVDGSEAEVYADRTEAGRALGRQVSDYLHRYRDEVRAPRLVLALTWGGVPVAEQVAAAIGAPLGAIGAWRQSEQYISGRTVVLVDDGTAGTGEAMAALRRARAGEAAHLVFATPVCAVDVADQLAASADAVLCGRTPVRVEPVAQWYEDFSPLSDEEVQDVLSSWPSSEVRVPIGAATLDATVDGPMNPRGVVLFAHGTGSSRHSPRNRMVAERLNAAGYVTVLLDLLTPDEAAADELTAQWRFDVDMLAGRLVAVIDWLVPRGLPLGLFGASTGAAAALVAAAERPKHVEAVVSRGGRPDLAGSALKRVSAPTLLIVGGADDIVIALNETASQVLADHAEMVIVPGASHLFTEPGALERVAELAAGWFDSHLSA